MSLSVISDDRGNSSFVDLFCGAGLLSYGFKAEGLTPALGVDLDRNALATYGKNLAARTLHSSVEYLPNGLKADILLAGPPCQGFSTLGRRDPKDKRNGLSLLVPLWAQAISAKIVVVENVPAFLQSQYHRRLVRDLQSLDFEVNTFSLEAADFGTPQYRLRSFTIGSKLGRIEAPQPSHKRYVTVGEAVFGRPIPDGDPMHRWPTPTALAGARFNATPIGGSKSDIIQNRPDLCPPSWARIPGQATDVWGRMHMDRPSNTIRCTFQNPSKGRYLHPVKNRVISLREGARIQGVPDDWVFVGQPYPVARQIGNGVPVPLGRALAAAVRQHLQDQKCGWAA